MAILPRRFLDPLEEPFIRDAKGNVVGETSSKPMLGPTSYRRPLPALGEPGPAPTMAGPTPPPVDHSGVGVPVPSLDGGAPTPYSPMNRERYEYVNQGRGEDGKYHRSLGDTLKGALRGFAQGISTGGGLAAGIGGAAVGVGQGVLDPKGTREANFDAFRAPRLRRDYADAQQYQAQQRQQQEQALDDQVKLAQIGAANRSNLPRPVAGPGPKWERGRNRRTGQLTIYNAADPTANAEHEPYIEEQRGFGPRWEKVYEGGQEIWKDLNAKENQGKTFRALPRPQGRGGSGDKNAKAMERAVAEFNQTKRALENATAANDSAQAAGLRKKLQALSVTIASKYGDQYETGGGEWPYLKARGAQPPQMADPMGIR